MARGQRQTRSRTSTLSIRQAGARDIDTLVHQRHAMWTDLGVKGESVHDQANGAYRRWAKSRLKTHKLMAWVVEDGKGTAAGGGCVWLQPVQPSPTRRGEIQPYLLSMYTEPEFRHRGVASMIVSKAIDWSRSQGYARLTLHASVMGRRVYEKFGFKRTREMRLDLGEPRLKARRSRPNKSGGS